MPFQQFAEGQFVNGVGDRPEQADRHRLDAVAGQPADHVDRAWFVERTYDLALAADPLVDLVRQCSRDVRIGITVAPVEGMGPPAFSQEQHIGVPARRQQRRARRGVGKDGIDRAGGAVDEDLRLTEEFLDRHLGIAGRKRDRVEDPLGRVVGRRGRLIETDRVALFDDKVGECATRIRREPHRPLSAFDALSNHDQLFDISEAGRI